MEIKIENILTDIFVILMGSAYLLGASGYETIAETKYAMFLVICGVYCAVMIFAAVQRFALSTAWVPAGACGSGGRAPLAARAAALVYMALTVVSAVCSEYFPHTIAGMSRHEGALTISLYVLTFIFVSIYCIPRMIHLAVLGISVIIFDVISLLQTGGYNPFGLYPGNLTWADRNVKYTGEFIGTIGNADTVSAFLCIVIPLFAVMAGALLRRRRMITGLMCAAAAALSLTLLIVTGVRAGLLAVLLVSAAAAPFIFVPARLRRRAAAFYLAALVAIVTAAGVFVYNTENLQGTAGELHEALHGNIDDSFGTSRVYIYRNVLEHVPEHLLLGMGPDTISQMDIEPFRRFDEKRGVQITAVIDTAHSEPLNILACQGLPALLAYAVFLAALGAAGAGALRAPAASSRPPAELRPKSPVQQPDTDEQRPAPRLTKGAITRPLAAALTISAAAYFIQSLFSFSSCATAPYFWLVCAVLAALAENPFQK